VSWIITAQFVSTAAHRGEASDFCIGCNRDSIFREFVIDRQGAPGQDCFQGRVSHGQLASHIPDRGPSSYIQLDEIPARQVTRPRKQPDADFHGNTNSPIGWARRRESPGINP
jgi:hypothetical protein